MHLKFHFLFIAFSLLLSNCASTQNPTTLYDEDPEFIADKQTAEMTAQFKLTGDQTSRVKEINLTYFSKLKEIKQESMGDKSVARSKISLVQNQRNADMKLVLNEYQYKIFLSSYGEQRSGNKGKRGNRGGGGRGRG